MHILRNINNAIANLWHFREVILHDQWWDSYFVFKVLKVKLEKDVKQYEKYGIHLHVQNDIDKMQACIRLLDRITKNEYLDNALMFFNKEHPDYFDDIDFDNRYIDKGIQKKLSRLYKQSGRQEKQDVEMLFDLMKKHIKDWWD